MAWFTAHARNTTIRKTKENKLDIHWSKGLWLFRKQRRGISMDCPRCFKTTAKETLTFTFNRHKQKARNKMNSCGCTGTGEEVRAWAAQVGSR